MKFRSNSPELELKGCYIFIDVGVAMGTAAAVAMGATAGGTAAAIGGTIGAAVTSAAAGAALGAGTAAITGGDVGQSAMWGGIGGGLTGGVAGAMGGVGGGAASGAVEAGGNIAKEASPIVAGSNIPASAAADITSIGAKAAPALESSSLIEGANMAKPGIAAVSDVGAAPTQSAFSKGLSDMGGKLWTAAKDNPFTTVGLVGQGITALAQPSYTLPNPSPVVPYHSQSQLSPNYRPRRPVSYKPSMTYDEGGIVAATDYDTPVDVNTGAAVGFAAGGPVNKFYAIGVQAAQQQLAQQPQPQAPAQPQGLPGYARGRMVHGQGTGISDGVPALIDGEQPAAIASGEYVIPARAVSEIGQGSSDAGAKRLDAMVAKVQQRRGKTMGKRGIAKDSKAYEALLA